MRETAGVRKLRALVPARLMVPDAPDPLRFAGIPDSPVALAVQRWLIASGMSGVRLSGTWDFAGCVGCGHVTDEEACVSCHALEAAQYVQRSLRQRGSLEYRWLRQLRAEWDSQLQAHGRERALRSTASATDTGTAMTAAQIEEVARELSEARARRLRVAALVASRLTLPVRCGLFDVSDELADSVFLWRMRERGMVSRLALTAVAGGLLSRRAYVDLDHSDLDMVERRIGRRSNYVRDQIERAQRTSFGRLVCT